MSQTEKFRKANELFTNIAQALSEKSTPMFETYMTALQELNQLSEEDQIFAINAIEAGNNEP